MQLYLIRHAQSQNNALPEEDRVEDPGLTEIGHQQAKLLGGWISQLNLTRLITSPFRRTLLTTEPIRQATSLVPDVRTDLHEQGGCYGGHTIDNIVGRPGMNRREIEAEFSGYRVAEEIDGDGWWKSRPYESWKAAHARAMRLFEQTIREFAQTEERVAYVMHADIKLLFLKHVHAEPLDVPYNTSVTRIEFTTDAHRLQDFNQIGHLPAELVTS
jgi:2,3-bisphosphoglycerate-dependent phosphoglycerate mutase